MNETDTTDQPIPRWPVVAGHDPRRHGHTAAGLCPPNCRRRQGRCPWPDTCTCDHRQCFAGWIDTVRCRAPAGERVTWPHTGRVLAALTPTPEDTT